MNIRGVTPGSVLGAVLVSVAIGAGLGCSGKGSGGPTAPPVGAGNHAPSVYLTTADTRLPTGGQTSFTVTAADADGDQLAFGYQATGGTVAVSGSTATTGTFTAGGVHGNSSMTVTASDGHGGTAAAVAHMYLFDPNAPTPTLTVTRGPCAVFTVASSETLLVEVAVTERFSGGQDHILNNDFTPRTLLPGQPIDVTPDDCSHSSGDAWQLSIDVQRPHDGITFSLSKFWQF